MTSDHPRSCGANHSIMRAIYTRRGSSPLVRGQLASITRKTVSSRIIPARAGPTSFMSIWTVYSTDHPRSCGANLASTISLPRSSGSSPLVRGQRHPVRRGQTVQRIIPARAGPTWVITVAASILPDHPRSCGANCGFPPLPGSVSGSSPLVRGQQGLRWVFRGRYRIIPARAGPTNVSQNLRATLPDHPRSCGANSAFLAASSSAAGSSPLVRGQPQCLTNRILRLRIIPARAGPTVQPQPLAETYTDHPRSCGANGNYRGAEPCAAGSSPLVRGQLGDDSDSGHDVRIIPARAGPTV